MQIGDEDRVFSSDGVADPYGGFTFNTCLASLHTYLGEVDDTHGRLAVLEEGTILNLPMFYLEGVVLFPEATLPLRVIEVRFKAAVERALSQVDAPCTIGVVRVYRHPDDRRICFATTGTTAEIRQYRQLDDGSVNVVARGQQRFRLRQQWTDVEGVPCAEIQIIQEDTPLRTPKSAFGQLASVSNSRMYSFSRQTSSDHFGSNHAESNSEYMSSRSGGSGNACQKKGEGDKLGRDPPQSSLGRRLSDCETWNAGFPVAGAECTYEAPLSFWPHWVYQMYDSYALARRVADLWRQIIGSPRLDDYIKKPDFLSFYIASKLPVSESRRQELLDIDGISYRLQKEIQFLKSFNLVRCRNCLTLIAKRCDMVVMSTDGPLNAYVNPHGYVHEIITVYSASGLSLEGFPVEEHSWFPGYAWTITNCASCGLNMGWLFTAAKKNLLPRSFWGIRSSQVTDDITNLESEGS